ncbi:PAS domain S-box protein [Sphingobium nicotianae]|uniref:histidine kinase n=1 Tax=Sphingobium nicotianae TaxID=2782607 RepID=A0A9X1DBU8_9SPHN|nr:PAS domain S-box protein [Sphingobium nicotianae]MBT2186783.1 PAS domain S-box protein [Sphingobium nicotianae]
MVSSGPADAGAWLAAVVENSFDAILSKTLDGIITSWNAGATRLFGYTAEEAIGRPITMLIPEDRLHEEEEILAKLRAGERVSHFETIRRGRNGRELFVELAISPVLDPEGKVVGASKIARDVTERRELAARQRLILQEMNHRIKNLFSIVQGLIGVSRRAARNADDFAADLRDRLLALDAAHGLILQDAGTFEQKRSTTLRHVVEAVLAPYAAAGLRIEVGESPVGPHALMSLALILHELATNAVKYGALSSRETSMTVTSVESGQGIDLVWFEHGVVQPGDDTEGFGTALQRAALRSLEASLERSWRPDGLEIRMSFPLDALAR